jgi:choline dehydrogenase-like flavoprotein
MTRVAWRTRASMQHIECMAFHPLGSARRQDSVRGGRQNGEVFGVPGLFIADSSILPNGIGVNSQVPIMASATRIA